MSGSTIFTIMGGLHFPISWPCTPRSHNGHKLNKLSKQGLDFLEIFNKTLLEYEEMTLKVNPKSLPQFLSLEYNSQNVDSHDDDLIIVRGNHRSLFYWTSITYTNCMVQWLRICDTHIKEFDKKKRPLKFAADASQFTLTQLI